MDVLWLIVGLALVTLGAEWLVRGASTIALRAGLSPLFVGLTVVGFGTSSPELGASLTATLKGIDGVSVGNVIGSNIFNMGVILGLTALAHPIAVSLTAVRRDLLVAAAAALIPLAAMAFGGRIPSGMGAVMLVALAAYLWLAYRTARVAPAAEEIAAGAQLDQARPALARRSALPSWLWRSLLLVAGGLAMLVFGSRTFVTGAVAIATRLGVSELVIGLTIVSAGTSLPELVTSLVAALRRSPDLAVGNVIGSNIFNLLGILGTCAVVRPQEVEPAVLWLHTPVMLGFSLLLLPLIRSGAVISRREGALLLAGYGVYLWWLIR
ncbi:MAG: calcium/sodium antiporter [Candidatus Krumholzibacteriia bacterium]